MMAGFDEPLGRIVVFRARKLGEMLSAVPALRALRAGFPQASITLVGLPWARSLARRLECVDEFVDFPGFPGVAEREGDVRELPDFLAQVQAQRFDLAVQLHGCDDVVNALVASFGARHVAGFVQTQGWRPPDDAALFANWPQPGPEVERLLALTDHLGLPRCGTALDFPLDEADREEARRLLAESASSAARYVCVHTGAPRASRPWDARRFAEVADAIAARGRTVVLTGASAESGLLRDVAACMRHEPVDLSGRTSLWTFGALIEGADSLICGDTGVSQVAAALGRPSVVVDGGPAR
jgi:ADP-heptose:LPS heptosyltransferase